MSLEPYPLRAPKAPRTPRHLPWRTMYGWDAVPLRIAKNTYLPVTSTRYQVRWSHQPGELVVSGPQYTGGPAVRYLVMPNQCLRRVRTGGFEMPVVTPIDVMIPEQEAA